jgi:uncharacterized protein YndB with AHSA1/START domain
MMGEFVEVDPYQRIVLTWGWEQKLLATPPQSTLVEVSFTPDGEDTIVQVAQRRLPAASASTPSNETVAVAILATLPITHAIDTVTVGIRWPGGSWSRSSS